MPYVVYYGANILAQFIFLVAAFHFSGRFLQIDFGRLTTALIKVLILTAIICAFWFVSIFYIPLIYARLALLAFTSWLSITLIFGLDQTECWLLTPIITVGSWLVLLIVNMAVIDILRAS